MNLADFMDQVVSRNPGLVEFHQAVEEVASKVIPYINQHPEYEKEKVLERMTEPDRVVSFRVTWEDEKEQVQVNRGYRVQFNNSIGPYKGGLRFDQSVNLSVLMFLGFEQIFKNSLTTLPIGGGKGGADFHPQGKTDREIMRFCQAFMTELQRHIGENIDVPAGDIGVGSKEISYLFGQYKRLRNKFVGTLTGKGLEFGGSPIRLEATGYGVVYFAQQMLAYRGDVLSGKTAVVSGSGNVAQYAVEKLNHLGVKVLTMSGRDGYLYDSEGINPDKLKLIMSLKNLKKPLKLYTEKYPKSKYVKNKKPWSVTADLVFPCATQNEIDLSDAKQILKNQTILVAEGANMPTNNDAVKLIEKSQIMYAPGKAANAGGVAISALEMSQNSIRMTWSREEVDNHLQKIMSKIHHQCVEYGQVKKNYVDYLKGANIAGFKKVADAMLAYGIV